MKKLFLIMRLVKTAAAAVVLSAIAAVGCVDNNYDLSNISPEIEIGGDEIVLPLAHFNKTLEDIIGKSIEDLKTEGDDQHYVFSFSSGSLDDNAITIASQDLTIPDIEIDTSNSRTLILAPALPEIVNLGKIENKIDITLPEIESVFDPVKLAHKIDSELVDESSSASKEYTANGAFIQYKSAEGSHVNFTTTVDKSDNIDRLDLMRFGTPQSELGTPITTALSLNALQGIAAEGSTATITLDFPALYTVKTATGETVEGGHYEFSGPIDEQNPSVSFDLYIYERDMSDLVYTDGAAPVNDQIAYSYDLQITSKQGLIEQRLGAPLFTIDAELLCKDALVETNDIAIAETETIDMTHNVEISGGITAVQYITFNQPTFFKVENLGEERIPERMAEKTVVTVSLPKNYAFSDPEQKGYFDPQTNILTAPLSELRRDEGVMLLLERIDCTDAPLENGVLTIGGEAKIDIGDVPAQNDLWLSEVSGAASGPAQTVIDMTELYPDLAESMFSYERLEVSPDLPPVSSRTVDVPSDFAEIHTILVKDGNSPDYSENVKAQITISLEDEDTVFPVDDILIDLYVTMGNRMHPVKALYGNGIETTDDGYSVTSEGLLWRPNAGEKVKVVQEVEFDAIQNLALSSGFIQFEEDIDVQAFITPQDSGIQLSELDRIPVTVTLNIDTIHPTTFIGRFDYTAAPIDNVIEIGDFSGLDFEVNEFGIAPVIDFTLNNPTGAEFLAAISLIPLDEDEHEILNEDGTANAVHIPADGSYLRMEGQTLSHFNISTKPAGGDSGTVYIQAELGKLFNGGIPSKIRMTAEAMTDASKDVTIELGHEYVMGYEYDVQIPLEFDTTDIAYTLKAEELNLGSLDGVKIEEVAINAYFESTIPFAITLKDAHLYDSDGNELADARIVIPDGMNGIKAAADGRTPQQSTLYLGLALTDGDFGHLSGLDALRLTLCIDNYDVKAAGANSILTATQYLNSVITIIVNGGITVDIGKLTEGSGDTDEDDIY